MTSRRKRHRETASSMLWTMVAQVVKARRMCRRCLAILFLVAISCLSLHLLSHFGHQYVFTTREHSHLPSIQGASELQATPITEINKFLFFAKESTFDAKTFTAYAKESSPTNATANTKKVWTFPTNSRNDTSKLSPYTKGDVMRFFGSHDVTKESKELLLEFQHRAEIAETACSAQTAKDGRLLGIFTHNASRVAYCFVPKVGCTFWIRVFSFLLNYTGDAGQVTSPWEIPRLKVHTSRHSHGFPWHTVREEAENYLRFMFVRDPYSRLWSAYLDKLFLPDFWREVGVPAVWMLRKNATMQARRCGHDVTFAEFVEYSLNTTEPHYDPIYKRCDPCQFRPTVIGTMETFARDSLFLLRQMNMEWVLKDVNPNEQEEKELATLISYNYQRVKYHIFYGPCVTVTRLAELLWKTFQFNGYIPAELSYTPPSRFSVEDFTAEVLRVYKESIVRKSELKRQKKEFMKEAFRSLGKDLMDKVEAKYALDMRYFGFRRFQLD